MQDKRLIGMLNQYWQKIVDDLIRQGKRNQLTLSQQILRDAAIPRKPQDGDEMIDANGVLRIRRNGRWLPK